MDRGYILSQVRVPSSTLIFTIQRTIPDSFPELYRVSLFTGL